MRKITKKPNILYRLVSRLIIEIGYLQRCKGYLKVKGQKYSHVVYFMDRTEELTHANLKKLVSQAFKDGFRPKKYLAPERIESWNYVPLWNKEYWKIQKDKSLFYNIIEMLFPITILFCTITVITFSILYFN